DQYSLALTYYRLRSGRLPFVDNPSQLEVVRAHCEGRLDLSGVGDAERAVLARATTVDPAARYPTCTEMVESLAVALGFSRHSQPPIPALRSADPVDWTKGTQTWPSVDVGKAPVATTQQQPV